MTSIKLRLLGFRPHGMIFQRPGEQIFGGVVYLVMCMCLATATKVLTVEMVKQLTYLSVSLVGINGSVELKQQMKFTDTWADLKRLNIIPKMRN